MRIEKNYVPILKWKAAEQTALEKVADKHKDHIVPIAEVVLPSVSQYTNSKTNTKKTDDEILDEMVKKMTEERVFNIPKEIKKVWGKRDLYLDVSWLHNRDKTVDLKCFTFNTILSECCKTGLRIIPVVNLADNQKIFELFAKLVSGNQVCEVCIRVTTFSLKDVQGLNQELKSVLDTLGLKYDKAHLLVDLKYIDEVEQCNVVYSAAQTIDRLDEFKTFIFSSGAFPVDMSTCSLDDPTYITRIDWIAWQQNVLQNDNDIRKPIFSDYSIRHPLYNDSLQFFESTSTLKYSLECSWMIMKGKKREFGYYLANASLLVLQPEFNQATFGEREKFSYGDNYIVEKAIHWEKYRRDKSIKGTGRTQDWIAAGISHHIALVMRQLSNLVD